MPAPVVPPGSSTSTPARAAGLTGLLTAEVVFGIVLFLGAFGLFFYLTRVVFREHSQVFDNWGFAQMDRLRAARPWTCRMAYASARLQAPSQLRRPGTRPR